MLTPVIKSPLNNAEATGEGPWYLGSKDGCIFITPYLGISNISLGIINPYAATIIKSGDNWIKNSTDQIKSKVIGFEGNFVSFYMLNQLKERANKDLIWKDYSEQISKERVIKSKSEVEKIEAAISISDRAFNAVSKEIEVGMTEKEIAWEIEKEMRID